MITEITTQSKINRETKVPEREITLAAPKLFQCETLEQFKVALGEEALINDIRAQLFVKYRSKVRALLESETDGAYTYSDEDIKAMDFSDWMPETRVRMTVEDKILKAADGLDAESLKLLLDKIKQKAKGK